MPAFSSYMICATPRSGSTLLCDLLSGTGVAGHPRSFFRQQDRGHWAERFGVAPPAEEPDPALDRPYVDAVRTAGSGDTGVFGLRLMWGSVAD